MLDNVLDDLLDNVFYNALENVLDNLLNNVIETASKNVLDIILYNVLDNAVDNVLTPSPLPGRPRLPRPPSTGTSMHCICNDKKNIACRSYAQVCIRYKYI